MRLRLLFVGAMAVAFVSFAACTSNTTNYTPTPTNPTPAPTPAPVTHLAGNETQTFTYRYGYPSPEPPHVIKTKITDVVSTYPTTPPAGIPKAANQVVAVLETDVTSLQTVTSTTNSYVKPTGTSVFEYASDTSIMAASGAQSSNATVVYKTAQQVADASPGVKWTNTPGAQIDETYSDGHYEDRTIASDGTYKEVGTTLNLDGSLAKIHLIEKPTGAGSYAGPFEGNPANTAFIFSRPVGTPPQINLVLYDYGQRIPQLSIPAWYAEPPPFYSEHSRSANATTPAACGTAAGTATVVNRTARQTTDTIVGYVDDYTVSTYSTANGPVCILLYDAIGNFYNWQGDSTAFLIVSPDAKPISTIVTAEALVGHTHRSGARADEARAGTSGPLAAAVAAAAEAHFRGKIEALHAKLRDSMMHHFAVVNGGAR